jgi:hypothetical protein
MNTHFTVAQSLNVFKAVPSSPEALKEESHSSYRNFSRMIKVSEFNQNQISTDCICSIAAFEI